jgi:hypothetical protein
MRNFIYGLIDPNTQQLRYVGQTSRGMTRPRSHRYGGTASTHQWAKGLTKAYEIVVLEECPSRELNEKEAFYIEYFHFVGCDLLNSAPAPGERLPGIADYKTARQEWEQLYWTQLMDLTNGDVAKAARYAGLNRSTVYEKLSALGGMITESPTPPRSKYAKRRKMKLALGLQMLDTQGDTQ